VTGLVRKSPTLELAAMIESARSAGETVYSLSTPTFEDRSSDARTAGALKTTLTPERGLDELRLRAREILFSKWALPSHECVITGGAKAAIFSVLRTSLDPGDKLLIVSPHWPTYEDLTRLAGVEPVFLTTRAHEQFAITGDALRTALQETNARAIICSNPGNPSGKIYSRRELDLLAAEAARAGAILIIDESFSSIVFDHEKWNASTVGDGASVFVINSFSKNFHLQGLRIGACLLPGSSVDAVMSAHQTILSAAPSPSQQIALSIGSHASFNEHDYAEQRQLMLDVITKLGWEHLPTEGSFYLFPRIPSAAETREKLQEQGIFSLPGEAFGTPYHGHTRICFGKPVSELQAMLKLLEEVILSRQNEVV
jgi:aspartate/methionine/tyrosine aminotransferase